MRSSALVLAAAAVAVLVADLVHKTAAVAAEGESPLIHERSLGYAVGILVAACAWCVALLVVRSRALALAGGLVLGGAAGNAVSALLWPGLDGTPNPFFVGDTDLGLAFNVADVAVVAGVFVVLPPALAVFALRNRHRLREPVWLRG